MPQAHTEASGTWMAQMRSEACESVLPRTHTEAIGSTLFQVHTESSGTTMPQTRSEACGSILPRTHTEASGTTMPRTRDEENEAPCLKRTVRHRERRCLECKWIFPCTGIRSYRARSIPRGGCANSADKSQPWLGNQGLHAIICDWKRCYGLLEATRCSMAGVCSCRVNTT